MKPQTNQHRPKGKQTQTTYPARLAVLDASPVWLITTATVCVVGVIYVLYNVGVLEGHHAVTLAGLLTLLTLLFLGLRDFIEQVPAPSRIAMIAVFALFWGAVTAYPFYRAINLGAALFTSELKPSAPPITIPLHDKPGHYNVLFESAFLPAEGKLSRVATYQIALGHDGTTDRVLEGAFRQEWHTRRIGAGRRASMVPVMDESTLVADEIDDPDGRDLTMQLKELSPGTNGAVSVKVYDPGLPKSMLVALGVLAIAAALVVDAWRPKETRENIMAMITVGVMAGIVVFRGAAASPGFPQLFIGFLAGGATGAMASAPLNWLMRPLLNYVS